MWQGHTHFFVDALFGNFSIAWFGNLDLRIGNAEDVKRFFETFNSRIVHEAVIVDHVLDWGVILWKMNMFRKVEGTGGLSSSTRDSARNPSAWHKSRTRNASLVAVCIVSEV